MNPSKARFAGASLLACVVVACVAGSLTACSAEAYGKPAYFKRLTGVPFEAPAASVECSSLRDVVHVFALPADFTQALSRGRASLNGYPERAGYQRGHTLVGWHDGPPRDDDWRFISIAADTITASAGAGCEAEAQEIRLKLWGALQLPTTRLAYSYKEHGALVGSMSFFVIDLEGGVFYDVEYAT